MLAITFALIGLIHRLDFASVEDKINELHHGVHDRLDNISDSVQEPKVENSAKTELEANWIAHAYPLRQISVLLQGTRHQEKDDIINQLETVLSRLRSSDLSGCHHDDDFGYSFDVSLGNGSSLFRKPLNKSTAGRKMRSID